MYCMISSTTHTHAHGRYVYMIVSESTCMSCAYLIIHITCTYLTVIKSWHAIYLRRSFSACAGTLSRIIDRGTWHVRMAFNLRQLMYH